MDLRCELNAQNNKITNLPNPTSNKEPATKEYVDNKIKYSLIIALS